MGNRSIFPVLLAGITVSTAVAALLIFKNGLPPLPPKAETVVEAPQAVPQLTEEEIGKRIQEAIDSTRGSQVIYEDVLGEGNGQWDSHPRYPVGTVNCIIWITELISEVYGHGLADKTPVMDRLRYYGGQPAFGLRKHYVTHSMELEPEPLQPVNLNHCAPGKSETIHLDFERFKKANSYSCPLYRADRNSIDIHFVGPQGLLKCAKTLDAGYYFVFGVASARYNEIYGAASGPLGLVHGMVIRIKPGQETKIFHASTAAHRVKEEVLVSYVTRMSKSLHRGYALYRLNPKWDYTKRETSIAQEADAILKCEKGLYDSGARRKIQ